MDSLSIPEHVKPNELQFLLDFWEEHWGLFETPGLVARSEPPGGGGGGGDDDGGGDDGDDDDSGGDDGDDDDEGGDDDDDSGDGDDDNDDAHAQEVADLKAENKALRRRFDDEKKARKKAERDLREERKGEGAEVSDLREEVTDLKRENGELRGELRNGAFERSVATLATKLRFKNPTLAQNMLDRELRERAVDEDGDVDERMIERALKKLATSDKYLVNPERQRQRRVDGDEESRERARSNGDDEYEFDPRRKMREGRRTIRVGRGSDSEGDD